MPELPEVETIKRGLAKTIVGKTIVDFDSDWHKAINLPLKTYRKRIKGLRVRGLKRRAKMLILELSGGLSILVHLKMTGQLIYRDKARCLIGGHTLALNCDGLPNKFTHATFSFKDGSRLYFNDLRKFGWVRLYKDGEMERWIDGKRLGPEPLSKEFSVKYLVGRAKKRPKMKIKQFIMDNSNLVGVGNIYSDEVCFYAKVKPTRRVGALSSAQIKTIHKGIQEILRRAIKAQGTTFSNYVNADGQAGGFVKMLKVYQRYGEKCFRCPGKVAKMKIGGRTSSFCPRCQK
ncbi:bifunctional DNA-formamidopyrimidine glycosylase/DNA-(apurinic or apyrimidinic site) lyase [Candidatus Margulisiibacteriota bacterium]